MGAGGLLTEIYVIYMETKIQVRRSIGCGRRGGDSRKEGKLGNIYRCGWIIFNSCMVLLMHCSLAIFLLDFCMSFICHPNRHGPDIHLPKSQINIVGPDFHLRQSKICLLRLESQTAWNKKRNWMLKIFKWHCRLPIMTAQSRLPTLSEKNYETLCFYKATWLPCIYKGIELITTK